MQEVCYGSQCLVTNHSQEYKDLLQDIKQNFESVTEM